MASTQITPEPTSEPTVDAPGPSTAATQFRARLSHLNDEEFHMLVEELRDEASRSRLREAFWISVIIHMVVLFLIATAPKFLPRSMVTIASPQDMIDKQRQLTYLDLPPDLQKAPRQVQSDVISDKNRTAQSRTPRPDQKLLDRLLRDNRRTGLPGSQSAQSQHPTPQQMAQMQQQQQSQQQSQQSAAQAAQRQMERPALQSPEEERPSTANPFKLPSASPGTAIQQAARAAATSRGGEGDYGLGPAPPNTNVRGSVEITTDTMGVDFGPYLERIRYEVQRNWYTQIPEIARPPMMKKGVVALQFAIMPDGSVQNLGIVKYSGDVSLDRAAWSGITLSNPFPSLPKQFKGPYLGLLFRFYYNPDSNELR